MTKAYDLTSQQLAALELLVAGETVVGTAASIGVARETVSRWRHRDPAFIAAYNEALQSIWEASHRMLLAKRSKALDKLGELIESEDSGIALRAATTLLKTAVPEPKGSIRPEVVEKDMKRRRLIENL